MAIKNVLIHSNSPHVGTGYGTQTAMLASYLQQVGYNVAVAASWGIEGAPMMFDYPVFPRGLKPDFNVRAAYDYFHADVLIALYDPFALEFPLREDWEDRRWISWCTVDEYPLYKRTESVLKEGGAKVVAYSKFGQRVLLEEGIPSEYIPLGYSPQMMYEEDSVRDKFIVGMVGRNNNYPSRKNFPLALLAFKEFLQTVPDARLRLHTITSTRDRGMDLNEIISNLDLKDSVDVADQDMIHLGMFSPDDMRGFYNEIKVLIQPSKAEGFGLPMIEAMACGVPVIATDCSSMTEIVEGSGGILLKAYPEFTGYGSFRFSPYEGELTRALLLMYAEWLNEPKRYRMRQDMAVARASKYSFADVTGPMWKSYLESFE